MEQPVPPTFETENCGKPRILTRSEGPARNSNQRPRYFTPIPACGSRKPIPLPFRNSWILRCRSTNPCPVLAMGCENPMIAGQMDSWFGYQGDQPGNGRSCASCARSIPYILYIKSSGSNTTCVVPFCAPRSWRKNRGACN